MQEKHFSYFNGILIFYIFLLHYLNAFIIEIGFIAL